MPDLEGAGRLKVKDPRELKRPLGEVKTSRHKLKGFPDGKNYPDVKKVRTDGIKLNSPNQQATHDTKGNT